MKYVLTLLVLLSTFAVAQHAAQVFHTHKMGANRVAIECDSGKPSAESAGSLIIVTCK